MKKLKLIAIIMGVFAISVLMCACSNEEYKYSDDTGSVLLGQYKGVEIEEYDTTATEEEVLEFMKQKAEVEDSEMNDAWALKSSNGKYKTVDEYKEKMLIDLAAFRAEINKNNGLVDALNEVVKNSKFKLNQSMVDAEYDVEFRKQLATFEAKGQTESDMYKSYGVDEAKFKKVLRETVEQVKKQNLVMNAIFEKEGMVLEEDDYTIQEVKYGKTIEQLVEENGKEIVDAQAKVDKVMAFIYENAKKTKKEMEK